MEPPKGDSPKLPDMIMCGDHPSITKTELNIKETDDKDKKNSLMSYAKISPSTSRTERMERCERAVSEQRSRVTSEHALRLLEARRLAARHPDALSRHEDVTAPANRALVQAALGSFRWPPYLVGVWVCVLLLTHLLHCVVTMLERALPNLKKLCSYFRVWTESSWRGECDLNHRLFPPALGCVTALLYTAYIGLYAIYAVALWAVEPLCNEEREDETKVTDYVDEVPSKHNSILTNK